MADAIGVLNAGSSSIKFSLFLTSGSELELAVRGQIEGVYTAPHFVAKRNDGTIAAEKSWPEGTKLGHDGALDHLVAFLRSSSRTCRLSGSATGSCMAGSTTRSPWSLMLARWRRLKNWSRSPRSISRTTSRRSGGSSSACLSCRRSPASTPAFHRTNPEVAQRFALPGELHEAGVRRYGFHGISYEYIASVLPQVDAKAAAGATVVLHLGNGASMCALEAGRSIASTMGFTALDGLADGHSLRRARPRRDPVPHGPPRPGCARNREAALQSVGAARRVGHLQRHARHCSRRSDPRAKLAVDLYCYRIRREIGSLAAALGGLDAIVFTGGIGENSAAIRERVCRDAAWLGVELDPAANAAGGPRISTLGARVSAWMIPTNEELMIARHTRSLLGLH